MKNKCTNYDFTKVNYFNDGISGDSDLFMFVEMMVTPRCIPQFD